MEPGFKLLVRAGSDWPGWASSGRRIALVTALVLTALVVFASGLLGRDQLRERTVTAQDQATVTASTALLIDLLNAETGQRGYLLTRSAIFLQPYEQALRDLPAHLRALEDATSGTQQTGLAALVNERMQILTETVRMAQAGDVTGAIEVVQAGASRQLMQQARDEVARVQNQATMQAADSSTTARRELLLLAVLTAGLGGAVAALVVLTLLARSRRWEHASVRIGATFQQVFDEAPIGMALFSLDADPGRFTEVNHELSRITGWSREELLAMTIVSVTNPVNRQFVEDNLNRAVDGTLTGGTEERQWLNADQSSLWVQVSVSVLLNRRVGVAQVVDITARKAAEARLTRQALYDSLTGLPNRTLLADHLRSSLARARRQGTQIALLYLDVDDFKKINDDHGHAIGDAAIGAVAQRLRGSLRDTDTAARIGGDEFLVIYEDVTERGDIDTITARLGNAMRVPMVVGDNVLMITVSIGVAIGTGDTDADQLISQADAAMYAAKRGGKGRHSVADVELVARVARNVALDAELRLAVEREEFRLHYQPVVEIKTGKIVSVEALLRWQHPERGLLMPSAFLDIAEERDLIVPIGMWAVQTACRQIRAWQDQFGTGPSCAVNVAARQFAQPHFAEDVRAAVHGAGISGGQLILEITERQIVDVAHSEQADLTLLTDTGHPDDVRLSLDDFGTGYSTFEYLRRFSFDILKIDRSFVFDLHHAMSTNLLLVQAMIAMATSLGLRVVAEGVENQAQLTVLSDLGCTYAQGYHLHRPMPVDQITALLAEQDAT